MQEMLERILLETVPIKEAKLTVDPYGAWKDKFTRKWERRPPFNKKRSGRNFEVNYIIERYISNILTKIDNYINKKLGDLYASKTYQDKPREYL